MNSESQHADHGVQTSDTISKYLHQLIRLVVMSKSLIRRVLTGRPLFLTPGLPFVELGISLLGGSIVYKCKFFQHCTVSKQAKELVVLVTFTPKSLMSTFTGDPLCNISETQHLHSMLASMSHAILRRGTRP